MTGPEQPRTEPERQRTEPGTLPLEPVRPSWLDAPLVDPYPFEETHDLRVGPDLHPALLGLLPFVGLWRGRGGGDYPTIEAFEFAQELRISHDGRPFLAYESRSWLIEPDGTPIRLAAREVGWWRPIMVNGTATDEIEALMVLPTGIMSLFVGQIDEVRLEMATDAVMRTATAKEVTGEKRLYGVVDRALLYATEMSAVGQPMQAHLSAKLYRVGG